MIVSINHNDGDEISLNSESEPMPRTELDSHANMVVLGSNAFIFDAVQHRTCDVQPYDPTIGKATSVPIVDGTVTYDCPISNKTYILAFHNALHIPTLNHNLIPPFILREAGLKVNDVAKIHVADPKKSDHAIRLGDHNTSST